MPRLFADGVKFDP